MSAVVDDTTITLHLVDEPRALFRTLREDQRRRVSDAAARAAVREIVEISMVEGTGRKDSHPTGFFRGILRGGR